MGTKNKLRSAISQPVAKRPYTPPKATFVPLKLLERLTPCYKAVWDLKRCGKVAT
jgi:hypothetical protein